MITDNIYEIYEFIQDMNASNSRIYKEQCLRKYENNDVIRYFLYFMYNPFIVTGISRKKADYIPDVLSEECDTDIIDVMRYLESNNTGSNAVLTRVYTYLVYLEDTNMDELAKLIISKNVQLGVEATTINKVFDNLIPVFSIQLAEKYFDHTDLVDGKKFTLTTKIDGGRIIAVKHNGEVSFYTRAGQPYIGLVDIEAELKALALDDFVIDGEITLLDKGNKTSKEQYKETMKITRKDGEKHGVKILAFDYMSYDDFVNRKETPNYSYRRSQLQNMFGGLTYLTVLPVLYEGNDSSVIIKYLDEQVANGEEGVMINFNDAPYQFKRTTQLLKVKKMQDVDLPIIGFEEGRNRHAGELGAFLVLYKDNIVKVGTGISDELRKEVWNNQDRYEGVTITVKYFEETTNDKGGISLRFPVFVDFRFDK